jgi:hypothetical protein
VEPRNAFIFILIQSAKSSCFEYGANIVIFSNCSMKCSCVLADSQRAYSMSFLWIPKSIRHRTEYSFCYENVELQIALVAPPLLWL